MASTERDVELADGLSARRDVPSTWSIGAAAVRRVRLAETERRRTFGRRTARLTLFSPRARLQRAENACAGHGGGIIH